jgi:hypothetical protein
MFLIVLGLSALFRWSAPEHAFGQVRGDDTSVKVKMYYTADHAVMARVHTVNGNTGNAESALDIRTSNGKLLAFRSFVSKDHQHGAAVMKGLWTMDSTYFVFSTISSGGNDAGHFPTYFFSRRDNTIRSLDTLMHLRVIDPEFYVDPDEIVLIQGIDIRPDGAPGDTLSRAAHLNDLTE